MNVLLDENFPLALLRGLRADGGTVDHIITLGLRGAPDERIHEYLFDYELLFLTEDADVLASKQVTAVIIVSRVSHARTLPERVEVWRQAVHQIIQSSRPPGRRFELMDDGSLWPWEPGPGNTWSAKPQP